MIINNTYTLLILKFQLYIHMKNYLFFDCYFCFFHACKNNLPKLKTLQGNAIGTTFSIKYLNSINTSFELKIDSLLKQ